MYINDLLIYFWCIPLTQRRIERDWWRPPSGTRGDVAPFYPSQPGSHFFIRIYIYSFKTAAFRFSKFNIFEKYFHSNIKKILILISKFTNTFYNCILKVCHIGCRNFSSFSTQYLRWRIRKFLPFILGDPEVTANIYCKSRNLPNTDTQNYSTDLR